MSLRADNYGIILAIDLTEEEKIVNLAKDVRDYVSAYKIGVPTVLSVGPQIISEISKFGPVICDFKIADIPEISEKITRIALDHNASGVIVHTFVGKNTVERVLRVAKEYDALVFALVFMTHPGVEEIFSRVYDRLIEIVEEVNVDGVVAPATRPKIIEDVRRRFKNKIIISPGIGAQGGDIIRTLEAGANYAIIGRAIYAAPDPRNAAKKLYEEINKWKRKRLF